MHKKPCRTWTIIALHSFLLIHYHPSLSLLCHLATKTNEVGYSLFALFFFNYITVLWVLNSLGLFSLCKIVQLFLVVNVSLYLFSVLFSVFIGRRFMFLLYTWTNLALTTLKDIRYNTAVQHSIDLFVTIFLRFNTLLSF